MSEKRTVGTDLFTDINKITEFLQLAGRFKTVQGWLSHLEGYLLYRLACDTADPGAVVEIGSWMGRSTCWLAAGSLAGGHERIYAIDVFDGGPRLKTERVIVEEGSTYQHYIRNLEAQGLTDHVQTLVTESSAAAREWAGGPIRLLFLDGDHSYDGVKSDFQLWSPHVKVGGYIVFDDAMDCHPGVLQTIREALADNASWRLVFTVGKTQTWCKVG